VQLIEGYVNKKGILLYLVYDQNLLYRRRLLSLEQHLYVISVFWIIFY